MKMSLTILAFFFLTIATSSLFYKTIAISLPMIPIDSFYLRTMPQSFNTQKHHQFLMNISLSRASMYAMERKSSFNETSLESPVLYRPSNYFVTQLSFGSHPHISSAYFVLDTGSDLTWVQCDGCNPCFQLKGGNIRVQLSSTYKTLSVDDPRCIPKLKVGEACGYEKVYIDGATTRGVLGTETFIFTDSNKTHQKRPFKNITFGCGLHNYNLHFGRNKGPENTIAGVFGIATGSQSFLTQLDAETKGRFSYCLVSWADASRAGYGKSTMYFGDDAQIREPNVQHIPMNTKLRKQYNIFLRDISVDGKRVHIDPRICLLQIKDIQKGFLIDSGSPFTVLPDAIYQPLRAAMVTYFAKYNWTVKKDSPFDLCYSSTPKAGQSYPSVIFHFVKDNQGGEVDWVMNSDNMFLRSTDVDGFCMVVGQMANGKICIFGAYQQANFKVLYDVKNGILSFAPKKCQESHVLGSST